MRRCLDFDFSLFGRLGGGGVEVKIEGGRGVGGRLSMEGMVNELD